MAGGSSQVDVMSINCVGRKSARERRAERCQWNESECDNDSIEAAAAAGFRTPERRGEERRGQLEEARRGTCTSRAAEQSTALTELLLSYRPYMGI